MASQIARSARTRSPRTLTIGVVLLSCSLALFRWILAPSSTFVGAVPGTSRLRGAAAVQELDARFALHPVAAVAPALAPAPAVTRPQHPGLPAKIDQSRFSEKVRWLMEEEQTTRPPEWHVLLLEKTFQRRSNTLKSVAAALNLALPLDIVVARAKAAQARDNFFAVVHSAAEWADAIRNAQKLQGLGLSVRVTPGTELRRDGIDDNTAGPESIDTSAGKVTQSL